MTTRVIQDTHVASNVRNDDNVKQKQQCEKESSQVAMPPFLKQAIVRTSPTAPLFMYIPISHRQDGKSPVFICSGTKVCF